LKNILEAGVVDSIIQWEVKSIVFAFVLANIFNTSRTGEIIAKLVERDSHHSIGGVESFFDTIAMVNIDVNVQLRDKQRARRKEVIKNRKNQ
jgi:hypothetical protein